MSLRIRLIALGWIFCQTAFAVKPPKLKDLISIPYGKNGRIEYHLQSGEFDLIADSGTIISGAYAVVKNRDAILNSKEYPTRKHSQTAIKDGFGVGQKHSIVLTRKGSPTLQQIFYVYPDREFFFTEVVVSGNSLKSNYMAPIVAEKADIGVRGDNRSLFVPFDNDAFVSYDSRPVQVGQSLTSSEVAAVYENYTRKGLIIGSVEHLEWKTGITTAGVGQQLTELKAWGGLSDEKITRDKIPHGSLSGKSIKSPRLFVGFFDDWRDGLEAYGKANRITEKPYVFNWDKPTPFGWNSWGAIKSKISFDKAVKVADFFADSLTGFRNDNTAYIDLDSFWDNFFSGGLNGDFSKLKEFADYCQKKGLQPGVYWAPFTDWGWKSRKVRKAEGGDYLFSDLWTKANGTYHDFDGGRALDPTHPGTKQRLTFAIKKLKECGFKMIKIDFLGHAAIESDGFYDRSVTTGMQAFRQGMEHLIDQLDGQMLIYAAISPNLAMGRYAHTRRIACDAWKTIKDTKYTLNGLTYGWWQTYVYNYIDADHIVFGEESEGANRARLTSGVITGTFITGDDYSVHGPWSVRARQLLQNRSILDLAKNGVAFKPVEGNSGKSAGELFVREIKGEWFLAVLNYDDHPKEYIIDLTRIGLDGSSEYLTSELFQHSTFTTTGTLRTSLPAGDAAIFKLVRK
ncbi:carbohydrate-binding protein [Larkinella terrae]|uniref:carbohydrate-binding protein n=1 Tax=Larkinella terrae TaxID=2025311 RepID=UPI0019804A15|nr:carbohydrate-binding protein [Larkinella terrae]